MYLTGIHYAVSGASKKEFLEKQLSGEMENYEVKSTFVAPSPDSTKITILNDETGDKYSSQVITPIISEDLLGCNVFVNRPFIEMR